MRDHSFTVNSEPLLAEWGRLAADLFREKKYVTFSWRIGEDRSLDQNALFHVWCTELAAHYLKKPRKEVTRGELEGMKRIVKKEYYSETGEPFMVHEVVNPKNPGQRKRDYTSSKDWKTGEMFAVLTWLQIKAANDGCVLESKGEFNKNQREQNGRKAA